VILERAQTNGVARKNVSRLLQRVVSVTETDRLLTKSTKDAARRACHTQQYILYIFIFMLYIDVNLSAHTLFMF